MAQVIEHLPSKPNQGPEFKPVLPENINKKIKGVKDYFLKHTRI
jgi:hypothetical protein